MKRLLLSLAAGILLFAVLPFAPAGAVDSLTIDFVHAPSTAQTDEEIRRWTPRPNSVLRDDWRIVVDAATSSSLKTFEVEIVPETSGIPKLSSKARTSRSFALGDRSSYRLTLDWDTTTLTPYNASYRIVARATSHIDASGQAQVVGVTVNNPPAVPEGADAELTGGVPTISWQPNTEPDLLHYRVLRSAGTLPFEEIVQIAGTSYSDSDAPKGVSLRYQVVAVRRSLDTGSSIASAPSEETDPLLIPKPPGAATDAGPVDIEAPTPQAAQTVQGREIQGPRRDVGFEPTLPYSGADPSALSLPAPQNIGDEMAQQAFIQDNSSLRERVLSTSVHKPPFLAAALILIAMAGHLVRISRRLLAG